MKYILHFVKISAKLNMGEPDFNVASLPWVLGTSKIVVDPSSWTHRVYLIWGDTKTIFMFYD